MKSINKESGQMSKIILILAGIVLLITVLVFVAIKIIGSKPNNSEKEEEVVEEEQEPPKPVYDITIQNIRFLLQSSIDWGSVLYGSSSKFPTFQKNVTTTERFIEVKIGAQNKGKTNTGSYAWVVGNIIDSEGRVFIPITNKAYPWLPLVDLCGSILNPEFEPVSCVRIYEVSKVSTGLKVQVGAVIPGSSRKQTALLDLTIK